MSPINRGPKAKGCEKRTIKLYFRVEPFELDMLNAAMRMTGDNRTDALRKGMYLYLQAVKKEALNGGSNF